MFGNPKNEILFDIYVLGDMAGVAHLITVVAE